MDRLSGQLSEWFDASSIHPRTVLATVALLLATIVVILLLNRILRRILRGLEQHLRLPYGTVLTVTRIVTGALWVLAVLAILDIWGVSLGGLWTLLVSAATLIGVGFLATWTMISNTTASLFITLWRPMRL